MKVLRSLAEIKATWPRRAAVTLGVFDGVHRGHRSIIAELLKSRARADIEQCYIITFDPHPVVVTHSRMRPPMLTTTDERVALLSEHDVDGVVVFHFDEALANVDYRSFLERYLIQPFNMKRLVLGYDCYFGKNREGSPERVQEVAPKMGFDVTVVPALRQGNEVVSSTKIRNALIEGDLERANHLLGHAYLISGTVAHGHGKGVGLGFPTANLVIDEAHKLYPPRGVYAVSVRHGDRVLKGMMNVGRAPTMKELDENAREIEVHLFDFDEQIYGDHLQVFCERFLREERKFPSVDDLVRQLEEDRRQALASLSNSS